MDASQIHKYPVLFTIYVRMRNEAKHTEEVKPHPALGEYGKGWDSNSIHLTGLSKILPYIYRIHSHIFP